MMVLLAGSGVWMAVLGLLIGDGLTVAIGACVFGAAAGAVVREGAGK